MFNFSTLVLLVAVTLLAYTPANLHAAELEQDDNSRPYGVMQDRLTDFMNERGLSELPFEVQNTIKFTTADGSIFSIHEVISSVFGSEVHKAEEFLNKIVDPETKINYDEAMFQNFLNIEN